MPCRKVNAGTGTKQVRCITLTFAVVQKYITWWGCTAWSLHLFQYKPKTAGWLLDHIFPPLHLFEKPTKEMSRVIPRRVVSQSLLRHSPRVLCRVACNLHPGYSDRSTGTANPTHVRKSQTRSGVGGPDGDASAALSLSLFFTTTPRKSAQSGK